MIWTTEEKKTIEEHRSLIESDPKRAIDSIIMNHNGARWKSAGRIILSLLLVLNARLYLEPADIDIEVQYSLDGGNNVHVLMYIELNGDEGVDDKEVCLREFGYELESFYGFDSNMSERIKSLVV